MEYMRWVNGGGEVHPGEFDIYNFGFEGQLPGPSIALSPGSDFTEIKEIYPGCALIGRAPTLQRSHWSRAPQSIVMLRQLSFAMKNQLKAPKAPYQGRFLPFAGSYGIMILGGFPAWKESIIGRALMRAKPEYISD